MVIRAYHRGRGDDSRNVVLIPASAHGTNPASAAMADMKVVVVASTKDGNIDVADLEAKAKEHRDRLSCLMVTYPSTHGVFEESIQDICAIVHAARRPGVHGRREHERAGGAHEPRCHWRGRVPSEPAQDVQHSARRRRSRHGPDWRGGTSGAVPAWPSGCESRRRPGDSGALGRAVGECQHPADFVRLHQDARRARDDKRHALRHSERQLHQVASRSSLSGALFTAKRTRRARDDLRSPSAQAGERNRRDRCGETPDGLRIPRAHGVLSGRGHADDRADGERAQGRARSLLRRDDFHSSRDSGGCRREGRSERQRPQECSAHGRSRRGRRMAARVLARVRGISVAVRPRPQVLAERRAHRQSVRRQKPVLRLPASRRVQANNSE